MFYWAKPVVTYRFTASNQAMDINGAPITAVELSDKQKEATRAAFGQWQAALSSNPTPAQRVFVEVGADQAADIEIVVVPSVALPSNMVGLTNSKWHTSNGQLIHATVQMRQGSTDERFTWTILHELGHALFSPDHASHQTDVMYPYVLKESIPVLSGADGETVREAYRKYTIH